jgi:hypothetical protein
MGRSSMLFFRKHVRGWRWVAVLLWRAGSLVKTVARLVFAGKALAAKAYVRGVWAGMQA